MSTSLDREENVVLPCILLVLLLELLFFILPKESYKSVNLNYNKEKEEEEEEEELCVILPYKTTYYTYLRVFTTNYFYYCTKVLTRAFFSLVSTLSAI